MAAPVGQLAVRLTAETGDFRRKLDSAQQSVGRLGREMRGAINAAAKYGAAIAGVGVAVGTKLVAQQLKAVDALAKTSDKLGIATQDLAAMRHAAELTGVSANTLDMALQRMTRRVAEAAMGTGEAKGALKELGLSAQNLARQSPDKQFNAIAGAMENVANQGDKVRLAMKLFDSEGVSLVNTLALGEQGLKEMREEADRLGISVSRVEAAQIEAANDAMTRAGAAMGGVVRRAAVDLAPLIEAIATEFANAVSNADDFGKSSLNAARMVVKPIGLVLDAIQGVRVAVKGLEVLFTGLGFGAVSSFNMIVRGYTELANLLPGIDVDFNDTFLGRLEQSSADALRNVQKELHDLAMQEIPSSRIEGFLEKIEKMSVEAAERMSAKRNEILAGGPGATEETSKSLESLRDRFKSEQELLAEKVQIDHETLVAALEGELITKQEFWELERGLKAEHEQKLTDIEEKAAKARQAVSEKESREKRAGMNSMFNDLSSLMNTESRKLFEIGKAAAISQTIMSTIESAQDAYKWGVKYGGPAGPALGAAAAAAALGAGFARVQAIRSTSFGAGGGTASAGGNGSVSAAPTSAQGGAVEQSPRRVLVEGIDPGAMFSGRQMIELINEAQQDGPALITMSR